MKLITSFACDVIRGLLFGGDEDGYVTIWNINSPKHMTTFQPNFAPISSIAISNNGEILATGDSKGVVTITNLVTYTEISKIENFYNTIYRLSFREDGNNEDIVLVDGTVAALWNFKHPSEIRELVATCDIIEFVWITTDTVAVADRCGYVNINDVNTGKLHEKLRISNEGIPVLRVGGVTQSIYTWDRIQVNVWDSKTNQVKTIINEDVLGKSNPEHSEYAVSGDLGTDEDTIVSADADGNLYVYEISSGLYSEISLCSNELTSPTLIYNNKSILFLCSDGLIRLWNIEHSRLIRTYTR